MFARGLSHAGPQKVGPGELHGRVNVTGIGVSDGDLVIGDEDGVSFVARRVDRGGARSVGGHRRRRGQRPVRRSRTGPGTAVGSPPPPSGSTGARHLHDDPCELGAANGGGPPRLDGVAVQLGPLGAEDELGTLNFVTPEATRRGTGLVRSGGARQPGAPVAVRAERLRRGARTADARDGRRVRHRPAEPR